MPRAAALRACSTTSCSDTPTRTPGVDRAWPRPRAPSRSARSCRPACGPTCSPRCSTPSPSRPALVVAGDDRAARDLAADLRAFLAPRPVRFYPARGDALRVAPGAAAAPGRPAHRRARRAARASEPAVLVAVAPPRWPRRCPTRTCARTASRSRRAACSTSRRPPAQLVACGYERVDQVEERGQFAVRGDILDVYPATEERAVRCELFDVEVERLTWFSTFTQRSLEEAERVEIAPGRRARPRAPRAGRDRRQHRGRRAPRRGRRAAGGPLPRAARPRARRRARGGGGRGGAGARAARPLGGRDGELPRPGRPPPLRPPGPPRARRSTARAALRLSSISGDQPHEFRAQSADTAARSLREAEPELEKLVRSGYRTIVTWARRGEAERAQLNLARVQAAFLDGKPAPARAGRAVRPRRPARGLPRAPAEAGRRARAPAAAPPPRGARRAGPRPGGASPPSPTCAPARPWSTRTTASALLHRLRDQDRRRHHARLPRARVPRRRPRVRAERPAAQDQPLRRAPTPATRSCRSSAASSGSSRSCAPAARPRRSRAS